MAVRAVAGPGGRRVILEVDFVHRTLSIPALAIAALALASCGSGERAPTMRIGDANAVALSAQHDPDPHSPNLAGDHGVLSVMSFNMAQHDRPREFKAIADDLRSRGDETPDFILLQEVLFERDRRKGPEPNTAAALASDLGYFCRATQRDNDDEGIGILSRYPFVEYQAKLLTAQTSGLVLGKDRISIMGDFQVPEIGLVRVVNVHLTNWSFDDETRQAQLRETLEWVAQRQRTKPADAIILGGDFNILPGWYEMNVMFDRSITGGIEFQDFNDRSQPTWGKKDGVTKRVDYIFIAMPSAAHRLHCEGEECLWADGIAIEGTRHRVLPSDHDALLHRYRLANTTAARPVEYAQ